MMGKGIMAAVVFCLLAGCAVPAPMQTARDWQENTQHRFPGKTPEEVLLAGEQLLRLADGKDVRFAWQDNRMVASRRWGDSLAAAAGLGVWHFDLTAVAGTGATMATLKIVGAQQSAASGGGEGTGGAASGEPVVGGLIWPYAPGYDLFWRRMEALLYGSEWFSCQWYLENPSAQKPSSVSIDPLCFQANDNPPTGVAMSHAEKNHWMSKRESTALALQAASQ